jgi:UDP-galactopyranose mutase
MSWDKTWADMWGLIKAKHQARKRPLLALLPAIDTARSLSKVAHIARRPKFDYLIVGGGFAGSVLAERLASDSLCRVLLVDRREHIGGNAYDHYDQAGVLVHKYGPHIFHTNSYRIIRHLSRFTEWRQYEHRVLAAVAGNLLPIPINRTTVNGFFGLDLSEQEIEGFLAEKSVRVTDIRTSEDIVLSRVGRELYEAFFRDYTRKQWGLDPSALDKSVAGRIPVRTNDDDRYFTDTYQQMPLHGFTRLFENMLDHKNITFMLGARYEEIKKEISYDHLIYTGPVDEYFECQLGKLPYRSLRFEHRTMDFEQFQPVAVVNQPSSNVPYTRVTEYKHLTGQSHSRTSISYEFPGADGDPYYPVPQPESAALYTRYQALADLERDTTFVGRLATYRYYNMDQVVAQALAVYDRLVARDSTKRARPRPLQSALEKTPSRLLS